MAAAHGLKWRERVIVLLTILRRLTVFFGLRFQALLELGDGRTINRVVWKRARLESTAIESRPVAIKTLPDNLSTTDNNCAMAMVKG